MKKTILQIGALAVSMLAASGSFGQALEKPGGYACVPELCIGDGMDELKKIKFQPATQWRLRVTDGSWWNNSGAQSKVPALLDIKKPIPKEYASTVSRYLESLRGDPKAVSAAMPYLAYGNFDNRALEVVEKIDAVCPNFYGGIVLQARYTGANDRLTTVAIQLVPDEQGAGQSWRVVGVDRYFPNPGPLGKEQSQEAWNRARTLYPTTLWAGDVNHDRANSIALMDPVETHHSLTTYGKFKDRAWDLNAYLANPLCKTKGVAF